MFCAIRFEKEQDASIVVQPPQCRDHQTLPRSTGISRPVFLICLFSSSSYYYVAFKKRPEPQISPKFVPAIAFGSSTRGDWNLSKLCQKIEKGQFPDKF